MDTDTPTLPADITDWETILAELAVAEEQLAATKTAMSGTRKAYDAETEPARTTITTLTTHIAALRDQLKRGAITAFAADKGRNKQQGALKLGYKPAVRVIDPAAAAELFGSVSIVSRGGLITPLVEWVPRFNEQAIRTMIEALEGEKSLLIVKAGEPIPDQVAPRDTIIGMPAAVLRAFTSPHLIDPPRDIPRPDPEAVIPRDLPRGWAGILYLTRKDDPDSYILQIVRASRDTGDSGGEETDDEGMS